MLLSNQHWEVLSFEPQLPLLAQKLVIRWSLWYHTLEFYL